MKLPASSRSSGSCKYKRCGFGAWSTWRDSNGIITWVPERSSFFLALKMWKIDWRLLGIQAQINTNSDFPHLTSEKDTWLWRPEWVITGGYPSEQGVFVGILQTEGLQICSSLGNLCNMTYFTLFVQLNWGNPGATIRTQNILKGDDHRTTLQYLNKEDSGRGGKCAVNCRRVRSDCYLTPKLDREVLLDGEEK